MVLKTRSSKLALMFASIVTIWASFLLYSEKFYHLKLYHESIHIIESGFSSTPQILDWKEILKNLPQDIKLPLNVENFEIKNLKNGDFFGKVSTQILLENKKSKLKSLFIFFQEFDNTNSNSYLIEGDQFLFDLSRDKNFVFITLKSRTSFRSNESF